MTHKWDDEAQYPVSAGGFAFIVGWLILAIGAKRRGSWICTMRPN